MIAVVHSIYSQSVHAPALFCEELCMSCYTLCSLKYMYVKKI